MASENNANQPATFKLAQAFTDDNPDLDIHSADLFNKPTLKKLKLDTHAKAPTVKALQAKQRLDKLHSSGRVVQTLMSKGITSANHLAIIPREKFVKEFAGELGLENHEAEDLHKRATGVRNKSMHLWASIRGTVASPLYRGSVLNNVSSDVEKTFSNLPSYQDLFGTLDYCNCKECRSIFGAAAYLVDLQRIIEEYVTKPNKNTILPEFLFTSRRPDIGEIELSCAKTNDLVPYLQIVNERLTAYAQDYLEKTTPDQVIEAMATTLIYPMQLPFNYPLDQINVLLNKVEAPYGDILLAWKQPDAISYARGLTLSPEQQKIVITQLQTAAEIAPFYNVTDITKLKDADTFIQKTWINFADLLKLLDQDLNDAEKAAGLQKHFYINEGLNGEWVKIEQPVNDGPYVLTNLDVVPLDQINRIKRLAAAIGQTVIDTDWALRCIKKGANPLLDDTAIAELSQLLESAELLDMDLATASMMLGPIKTYGKVINGSGSAFDTLFNSAGVVASKPAYRPSGNPLNSLYTITPLKWTPEKPEEDNTASINRVLPGLGMTLNDANTLGKYLYGTTEKDLTVDVLSVLYRHALLSRSLRMGMEAYVLFLQIMKPADPQWPSAAELNKLVKTARWMDDQGVNPYHMDYIINGNLTVYVNPRYQPDRVDEWLRTLWVNVKPGTPETGSDITAQIAILFGADVPRITAVREMAVAAVTKPTGVTTWEDGFMTADTDGKTPKYGPYVRDVLKWVSRWIALSDDIALPAGMVAGIAGYPGAYGLPDKFDSIGLQSVQWISMVQVMMKAYGDFQQNLLVYIARASENAPLEDQLNALQNATGWLPRDVESLLIGPLKADTIICQKLQDLQVCITLMDKLGANPELIDNLVTLAAKPATGNWELYKKTCGQLIDKIAGLYGQGWPGVWATLSGDLALHLRDALLPLVLAELNSDYKDITAVRNVYEFLLTDVEMGPETSISYVKEALNACQTYLQRCRLRLEPGVLDMSNILEPWWEWMMNYRVWEANRQIFVYPENYLIPTLRKNVTPQFAALSKTLQQGDITKAYVGSAFSSYINGFSVVAELKPVDAYRSRIENRDTIYLLSRTKTGPYVYYYCEQPEFMPWTPWEKIDLTINSPNCSLIYAFNRPFIFWAEITKNNSSSVSGTQGEVTTNNSLVYTATLKYSFLNQDGEWVQPQILVDQETIYFNADDSRKINLKNSPIFEGDFNLDDPDWNKVFAFSVNADNYVTPPSYKAGSERLVVMYGPNIANTGSIVDAEVSSPTTDPNAAAFWANLHVRAEDHNRMIVGQNTGYLPLMKVRMINASLEHDVLVQHEEFIMNDPYLANGPLSNIQAELQSSGEVMQIARCAEAISCNRKAQMASSLDSTSQATQLDGDSFIATGINSDLSTQIFTALKTAQVIDANGLVSLPAMVTLDLYKSLEGITAYDSFGPVQFSAVLQVLFNHMEATPLFSQVKGSNIVPVATQPGWFMFTVSDEIFLLTPKPKSIEKTAFSTFALGLRIGAPLLTQAFAIMKYKVYDPVEKEEGISVALSKKVYDRLIKFSLISNGRPTMEATWQNFYSTLEFFVDLEEMTDVQIGYVYRAFNNAAIIFKQDFVPVGVSEPVSEDIFKALMKFSIIDPVGRIDDTLLTGRNVMTSLGNLLSANKVSQSQIASVYKILAACPKAVQLTYNNDGDAKDNTTTAEFVFDVVRLSTGAINKISRALFVNGVDELLSLKTQQIPVVPVLPFDRFKPSVTNLVWPSALDATQVDFDGLYGQYYWEIFYHIPMLVSYTLKINQKFPDATTWHQYIFNPTIREEYVTPEAIVRDSEGKIFIQQATGIVSSLKTHNIGDPPAPILNAIGEVNPGFKATTDLAFLKVADPSLTDDQITMVRNILLNYQLNAPSGHYWQFRPFRTHNLESLQEMLSDKNPAMRVYNDDPFDPFAIARLRIGAFEKATLIQYIDNLVAWGDNLFTEDTWESITAAYMIYVYAYNLLGPRPQEVGVCPGENVVLTFNQIAAKYPNGIPQFLIELEHFTGSGTGSHTPMLGHAFNDLNVYFCVPENADLMRRWDLVEDRMYKINHSLNINGIFRQLPLFEPPLNPLDLIKAAKAGNNIQMLTDSKPKISPYRYTSISSVSAMLCSTLIELGSALLAALEKNDAEALSALQANQQGQILDMTTTIKEDRISELKATIAGLNSSLASANNRLTYYTELIDAGLSGFEKTSLDAAAAGLAFNILAGISKTAASIGFAIPQVGSPFAMTYGGIQVGSAVNAASGAFEIGATVSAFVSQQSATMGGYERRGQEWGLQKQQAVYDSQNIQQQIDATNYQLASAQQDLTIHLKTIEQNKVVESYLKDKFTNQELYQWMIGSLSGTYFQTYALALEAARQAEASFQYELNSTQRFLSFDYWDSLHKGLTAGEGLRLALNRMDSAFRAGDVRTLDIVKTIPLSMLAPNALLSLINTGKCSFQFTEALFDYDYPGQYSRKIKTISVSIPAVLGPYQDVKAILKQTKNYVVTDGNAIAAVKYLLSSQNPKPSTGLREDWGVNQSIALSKGVDDSGMFVMDFQDPRYLPFENTGAVSDWELSMPKETNRFDFNQLSDVIITLKYTAFFDGKLETDVKAELAKYPLSGGILVNGNMQSSAWVAFLMDTENAAVQTLTLKIDPTQMGFFNSFNYYTIILQLELGEGVTVMDGSTFLKLVADSTTTGTPPLNKGQGIISSITWDAKKLPTSWKLEFDLNSDAIKTILKDGHIDGKKLLNVQLIGLYNAKLY
ncbi:neuraminidase-like domain-containing protein [Mucilaginibacter lappiensis]|uniref:Tc toxin subunit A-related protein n=1 Tax=Mucilaginibacter lappiensis TaxID=354630 RepID=UPI003D19C8E0